MSLSNRMDSASDRDRIHELSDCIIGELESSNHDGWMYLKPSEEIGGDGWAFLAASSPEKLSVLMCRLFQMLYEMEK